ncbi:hypothetical protein ElyMa_006344200 [Elysia marginata]|uniref:Uncharacterized protein n=1 Tax=Elysia marginata TaxID=1093978 RepID=A0AAV4HMC2_9GAST|nr:hypothetical protein ElyMa_006344200 [Elysia marginata]
MDPSSSSSSIVVVVAVVVVVVAEVVAVVVAVVAAVVGVVVVVVVVIVVVEKKRSGILWCECERVGVTTHRGAGRTLNCLEKSDNMRFKLFGFARPGLSTQESSPNPQSRDLRPAWHAQVCWSDDGDGLPKGYVFSLSLEQP